MSFNYIVCVIANHQNDLQKQTVANALATLADPDPNANYDAEHWTTLYSAGQAVAWGVVFACTADFVQKVADFNSPPPTYPDIGASPQAIDLARSFMTLATDNRQTPDGTQQLDFLTTTAAGLGLSL